ncbi:phage tail tape measure protein (plasmid) [Leptospira weilii]|uniref:phage tail tape measure protein n=1 Tax=Leptospira weilii TaxID=28184 RepID=UPI00201B906D|nr:phage tail tape measure protein [Leptospira weilii]UPY79879.1 phage tail tape measure protein [Leptospira weilii]UPY80388.1 phage tail tape measure protein [Leptospira weilii]UPY81025.1 phage tail tape measure protein [Leptospira weilii]
MDSSIFELGVVITLRDYASSKLDEINDKWDAMKKKLGDTHSEVIKMESAIKNLAIGGVLIGAGLAVGSFTMSLANSRMETSKLEGNLKSLGLTSKEVDNITKSAYSMSSALGESTDSILSGVYDIKSAVSDLNGTELVGFTQSILDTTIATKGNFGELSKLFGMAYHQFKHLYSDMDNVQFGKNLANDIAWASNVYRADGNSIQQAMESIGSKAASLKISLEEQSAVLGTLLNSMQPGPAGTTFRAFLTNLGEGFSKLGLNAYQADGKLKNTADLLGEIKKKFGDSLDLKESDVIKKAFGTDEAVQFINTLLPKTDALGKDIKTIVDLSKNQDYHFLDIAKQANLESLPTQMKRASEGWENFKKILGKGVEDSGLKKVFSIFADGISVLNDFLAQHPKIAEFIGTFLMLTTVATLGAGAFFVLKGAWTAFTVAMNLGLVSNPIGWIVIGVVAAIAGIALLITYWDEIKTAAVSAWTWITETWAGLGGFVKLLITWFLPFIGIPLLIHEHWSTIKDFLFGIWDGIVSGGAKIKSMWNDSPSWFKGLAYGLALLTLPVTWMIMVPALIIAHWDTLKNFVTGFTSQILDAFNSLPYGVKEALILAFVNPLLGIGSLIWSALSNIIGNIRNRMKESGSSLFSAFGLGIMDSINDLKTTVNSVMSVIARFLPHSNADEGPLSNLTGSGAAFVDTFALGMKQRKATLGSVLTEVTSGFETGWGSIKNTGVALVETFSTGVRSNVDKAYNAIIDMANKIRKPLPNSDAKEGPLSTLTRSGRATVSTFAAGIEMETPRLKPVMQRFNEALAPEKGIIRRLKEESDEEEGGIFSGKKGSTISIGSLIGQLVVGGGKENKRQIGEILADALFEELDRYDEVPA